MKNLIALALMASVGVASAETIFYAPSKYDCSSQNKKCVCTQTENQYFPVTIEYRDCPNKSFTVSLSGVSIDDKSLYANYYENNPSGSGTGLDIKANVYGSPGESTHWRWGPYNSYCSAAMYSTEECPIILSEPSQYK